MKAGCGMKYMPTCFSCHYYSPHAFLRQLINRKYFMLQAFLSRISPEDAPELADLADRLAKQLAA